MIFKELNDKLKKIKDIEDLNHDLANELISAGISSYMSAEMKEDEELSMIEAFESARTEVMRMFDFIFLDIMTNDDDDEDDEDDEDSTDFSPMQDKELNASIQKAIEEYNRKMDKKNKSN